MLKLLAICAALKLSGCIGQRRREQPWQTRTVGSHSLDVPPFNHLLLKNTMQTCSAKNHLHACTVGVALFKLRHEVFTLHRHVDFITHSCLLERAMVTKQT